MRWAKSTTDMFTEETFKKLINIPSEIRWFGDPILRQEATPFSEEEFLNGEVAKVVNSLIAVLKETRDLVGIGRALAAPQIGLGRRAFVRFQDETDSYEAFINPHISAKSEEQGSFREMCLSGMPLSASVVRPWEIELVYNAENGDNCHVTADPMLSRVAQHEIDHLDGILFIDRVKSTDVFFNFDWESSRSRNKLVKIVNGA